MTEDLTRRRLLGMAGLAGVSAGATGLGVSGCSTGTASHPTLATQAADTTGGPPYVSRPDLTPPRITIRRHGLGPDTRYIFLNAPYSGPGHGGSLILDPSGELVWMGPNTFAHRRMNVSVQSYQGQPVLTWWQGEIVEGFGRGAIIIADSSYRVRHVVKAQLGQYADFHEVNLTPHGTALLTVYKRHRHVNLTAVGGQADGYLVSGMVQEIDIATGKLVFQWDSYAPQNTPVRISQTYQKFGIGDGGRGTSASPFNYFHINSICEAEPGNPHGDLLVSARNTWAIYRVSRRNGGIVWRMGGKKSNFTMGPRSKFYWQHHVRPHGNGVLTVFDNGGNPAEEKSSRALILGVDEQSRRVTLKKAFIHPGRTYLGAAMGSAQLLPDGRMFVGWGTEPHFSEFAADGRLLLDGDMAKGAPSYRVFTQNWTGHPADLPAAAARRRNGGATVYASWNGATLVRSWAVYAGPSASSLHEIGTARKAGFETAIAVTHKGPYFAAEARDAKGRALARSAPVKIG